MATIHMRFVFEEVSLRAAKSLPCPGCGKKVRRQKTFTNTVNPWNVNEDGTPRTRDEIWEVLRNKASVWQTEPERHTECKGD